jgi:PAS domain S-box-containing protein
MRSILSQLDPRTSIASRITLFCLLIVLICIAVVAGIFLYVETRVEVRRQYESLERIAVQMTDTLDRGMFERYRDIVVLAQHDTLQSATASTDLKRDVLEVRQETFPDYAWIGLTDPEGTVSASTGRLLEGINVSQRPWFQAAINAPYVGDVHEAVLLAKLLPQQEEPWRFVDVAAPVFNEAGEYLGVVGAHLSWSWANELQRALLSDEQRNRQVEIIILNSDGQVLLAPDSYLEATAEAGILSQMNSRSGAFEYAMNDGKKYLVSYSKDQGYREYPGLGWIVLVRQPQDVVFAEFNTLRNSLIITTLIFSLLVTVLVWFVISRTTAPLLEIAAAADTIRQGKKVSIPTYTGNDEVALLSSSLKNLVSTLLEKQNLQVINTDLKQANRIIETERARDEAILNNIGDGILVVDTKEKILLVNNKLCEMLGYSAEELQGKKLEDVIKIKSSDNKTVLHRARPLIKALEKKETTSTSSIGGYVNYRRTDGTFFPGATSATPVIVNGKVIAAVEVIRDVTRERDVDRMKTEFISLASHQLRTPLSAMRWYLEMLLAGDAGKLTKEQKQFVENIDTSNTRMIALVNSLLNVSRIESGRIIVEPVATQIGELLDGVIQEVTPQVKEKKISLVTSIHPGLPDIMTDPRLLRNVYMNLLTNAVKYTPPEGEVTIFVSKTERDLVTQITDTGYGIPEKEQPKLFEKFFRATNVVKLETDGNGLGMYLVKAVVDSLGGSISFKSIEGKGTTFWVSLPLKGIKPKKGEVSIDS